MGRSGGREGGWCPVSSQYRDTLPVLEIVSCSDYRGKATVNLAAYSI